MLLQVNDLHIAFRTRKGVVKATRGVSFALEEGKTLALVGESGSGKSVSAMSILGLLDANGYIESGEILFDEKGDGNAVDLTKIKEERLYEMRGNQISVVFQEPMTALNPVFSVCRQLAEPFVVHRNMRKKQAEAEALKMLSAVRIPNPKQVLSQYAHQLSGGMRQRVMIAMALACNPKVLIADEPTTALDVTIQAQILRLLQKLQRERNTAILFITHDLGVVNEVADEVAVMYCGEVVENAPKSLLFHSEYAHPYTQGLLSSMPSQGKRGEKLEQIPGSVPPLHRLPKGCKFAPRCKYCTQKCVEEEPKLYCVETGQKIRCFYPKKEERERANHPKITLR
ncbi:MAG: ABC transporter ATP-binding protein [Clostridiales bacterium]|nr:ABC transporter ATP-binding protein [Clostridiales bacterium]